MGSSLERDPKIGRTDSTTKCREEALLESVGQMKTLGIQTPWSNHQRKGSLGTERGKRQTNLLPIKGAYKGKRNLQAFGLEGLNFMSAYR